MGQRFCNGAGRGLSTTFPKHKLQQMDEERRLFYVAVTRAKDFLFLTYSSERGELARAPSPYLFEILDKKIIDGVPYINETLDQASVASKA